MRYAIGMEHGLFHIGDVYTRKFEVVQKSRATERGDLLKYFSEKTGRPIKYIAFRLTAIPTSDLYHLQKQCDTYKGPWAKAFFGQLKVRK